MDEMRFSNVARSSEWAEAEYINGNNTMASFGAEQQLQPDAPVLSLPASGAIGVSTTPQFNLRAGDPREAAFLRYKIDICSTSNCSVVIRTIDQTDAQTGWTGQDSQGGTAYAAGATVAASTMAAHTYQAPALSYSTQYWWRGYAIDPGDSNTFSDASTISSFTTQAPPQPPALESPANGQTGVLSGSPFRLRSTDANGDYLRYKIDICSTSNCSVVIRTIDQTVSQTGWLSMGASNGTAYIGGALPANSQTAIHQYQAPLMAPGTYWWRGYAIDPAGSNQFSAASSIASFTVGTPAKELRGGIEIRGGTDIGQ